MLTIKIAGIVLLAAGLITITATLIMARNNDTFSKIQELRRIRETGYVKEHHTEVYEDIYKKEEVRESRLMSRRAKRVLERMEQAERTSEKPQGSLRGTSLLEEVEARPATENPKPENHRLPEDRITDSSKNSEENTDILSSHRKPCKDSEEATGVLSKKTSDEEGTDILDKSPADEEATGVLSKNPSDEEGTDILDKSPADEDTGILSREEGTDILPAKTQNDALARAAETDEEKTDILVRKKPAHARSGEISYISDPEKTDVLIRITEKNEAEEGEATDILVKGPVTAESCADEEGTAILKNTSRQFVRKGSK